MTINCGLNKVRFPSPLEAGQRYRLELTLAGLTDGKGGVECAWNAAIELEGEPRRACVAEVLFRVMSGSRRAASGGVS